MTDLFACKPRRCRCGAERVDTGDIVAADRSTVAVHGLEHCFTYMRIAA